MPAHSSSCVPSCGQPSDQVLVLEMTLKTVRRRGIVPPRLNVFLMTIVCVLSYMQTLYLPAVYDLLYR